ncbi:hypothetical protein V2K50_20015 [Pseudomonas alliivorans]|nr:hypothetical protein [Pseudomonas alliivorans]
MTYFQISSLVYFLSIGLCFVLYIEYKKYRVDKLRFKLFCIRDELFNAAREGKIPFDSNAYQIVRDNLNGMIRYSHELSFLDMFLMKRLSRLEAFKARSASYKVRMDAAMKGLDAESKRCVDGAMRKMHFAVFTHISFNSPLAILLTVGVIVWVLVDVIINKLFEPSGPLDVEASHAIGSIHRRMTALDTEVNVLGCRA